MIPTIWGIIKESPSNKYAWTAGLMTRGLDKFGINTRLSSNSKGRVVLDYTFYLNKDYFPIIDKYYRQTESRSLCDKLKGLNLSMSPSEVKLDLWTSTIDSKVALNKKYPKDTVHSNYVQKYNRRPRAYYTSNIQVQIQVPILPSTDLKMCHKVPAFYRDLLSSYASKLHRELKLELQLDPSKLKIYKNIELTLRSKHARDMATYVCPSVNACSEIDVPSPV